MTAFSGKCLLAAGLLAMVTVPAAAKEKVTFAYLLDPAYDAVMWPLKTGKVTSDTIDVETKSLDIPALLQVTGAKSYDVVMTAAIGVPAAKARGLDLTIMAAALRNHPGGSKGADIYVKADSPYKTIEDLKGKTIGNYSLPSTGTTLMRLALWKQHGINVSYDGGDMKWVEMPASALPGALITGRIDAATLSHSQAYLAEHSKDFRLLIRLNEDVNKTVGGPAVSAVLVGYPEKLAARPEAYKEFIRVVKASSDYTRTHVPEVSEAMNKETKIDAEFFRSWLNDYFEAPMVLSDSDEHVIGKLWELSKELGIIKSYPEVSSVVCKDALRQ
jgi:NitT/TauT family transport system substrate-binding protein